jgi:hypothetical protein
MMIRIEVTSRPQRHDAEGHTSGQRRRVSRTVTAGINAADAPNAICESSAQTADDPRIEQWEAGRSTAARALLQK